MDSTLPGIDTPASATSRGDLSCAPTLSQRGPVFHVRRETRYVPSAAGGRAGVEEPVEVFYG